MSGGEHGRARAAVRLAEQEVGRGLALVHRDVAGDEVAHQRGVAVHAPEAAVGERRDRLRVAAADRVDEHQVGDVDQALGVVDQLERLRHAWSRARW